MIDVTRALEIIRAYRSSHLMSLVSCDIHQNGLGVLTDYRCQNCKDADSLTGDTIPVNDRQTQLVNHFPEGR